MKRILYILAFLVCLVSCNKYQFADNGQWEAKANAEKIFGINFDPTHDWCTTTQAVVSASPVNGTEKIQLLVTEERDSAFVLRILNEVAINKNNQSSIDIYADVPINNDGLLLAFIKNDGDVYYQAVSKDNIKTRSYITRSLSQDYILPSATPVIDGTVETFAAKRNWLPGEVFYTYNSIPMASNDYDDAFKTVFRSIIFNYFPNGRKYNNLPKIEKSGYYNETSYPVTTGKEPIIVSPVYKNDGGYHEISEAELYYYYFKDGNPSASEIEALPKYRAIDLSTIYENNYNDKINKSSSFALVYFGDGIPTEGTTGSFQFPEGYKIGFCYKSNTESDQKKKQGEVYGDGRLNYNINKFGNFASSKLGDADPRMAWMTVNSKMFLCVESGTDKDYNDLILEVEGGIKPIIIIPDEPEYNFYTFLFEDHNLGDYDMNDIVIKARRIDATHVEYSLIACGAADDIYVRNIKGNIISEIAEVHDLFGVERGQFINTTKGSNVEFVKETIAVTKDFSFLNAATQPYIYDATIKNTVKLATIGQDPHAIMIPYDFRYPLEKICIKDAYKKFNEWGENKVLSTDWYVYPEADKVF